MLLGLSLEDGAGVFQESMWFQKGMGSSAKPSGVLTCSNLSTFTDTFLLLDMSIPFSLTYPNTASFAKTISNVCFAMKPSLGPVFSLYPPRVSQSRPSCSELRFGGNGLVSLLGKKTLRAGGPVLILGKARQSLESRTVQCLEAHSFFF